MDFTLMHPRDQIVMIMERIYGYGMTTTSGGNLSILDDNGDLWITPTGVDKGSLKPRDIMVVRKDGQIEGMHKPSCEYPFHLAILQKRPEMKAVLHAHPTSLVAFAITRQLPNTKIVPNAQLICGEVGYAKYAMPGSQKLGDTIADTFAEGHDSVLLENHGVVTAGENLFQAFQRFETLDLCARLILKARVLGKERPLTTAQFDLSRQRAVLETFVPERHSSRERELRKELVQLIHRSYNKQLATSTEGTFSVRVDENSFLITPYDKDRAYLGVEDLVLIQNGKKEEGTMPSRSVLLHQELYDKYADLNAVIIAHPPNVMAFGVSDGKFETHTIPESYIILRDIPVLPYGTQFMERERVCEVLSEDRPVVLVENDCVIVRGDSLIQAFDRLEVAEFSAKTILSARALGEVIPINAEQIQELEDAFLAPKD